MVYFLQRFYNARVVMRIAGNEEQSHPKKDVEVSEVIHDRGHCRGCVKH